MTACESDWKHFERVRGAPVSGGPQDSYDCGALHFLDRQGRNRQAPKKAATVLLRLAAINAEDKRELQFLPASPKYSEVSVVVQGMMRAKGTAQAGKRPMNVKLVGPCSIKH